MSEPSDPAVDPGRSRSGVAAPASGSAIFAAVFDCLPDAIAVLDERGRVVAVNEAWRRCDRTGPGATGPGAPGEDALRHPAATEPIREVLAGTRKWVEFECPGKSPVVPFRSEMRAEGFTCGGRRWALLIRRDASQQHQTVKELRASEARYRGVVERIRDGILVHDGKQILYANPSAERALGYEERGALVGTAVLERVAPEFRERVAGRIDRVLAEGRPSEPAEIPLLRRDGTRLVVEVFGVPAVYDGRLAIQAVFREIQERARPRVHEREASHTPLRQPERLAVIGTLAAGIAHEINNPVGTILLAARNALAHVGRSGGEEVAARCLRDIVRSARRCGQIVRSVLQLARQEPLERWEADLNESVRHAVELTEGYARARGSVVELLPGTDLPPVVFNPLGIEQVVVNLIRNGCEASSAGGGWVRVSTQRSEQGVQICVRDNGRGLTREEIEQIFDPFFTTRRQEGGTGLGLSIAHGIVMQHGGTIWVESEPERGCQITVELPLTPGAAE